MFGSNAGGRSERRQVDNLRRHVRQPYDSQLRQLNSGWLRNEHHSARRLQHCWYFRLRPHRQGKVSRSTAKWAVSARIALGE